MSDTVFKAKPTLVIGLGGTGLKVATFVKKSLLETNRNQLPEQMAILVLDTERGFDFKAGARGSERTEAYLTGSSKETGPVKLASGEYYPMTGNVRRLVEQIKNEQKEAAAKPAVRSRQPHRHISGWFQARYYLDDVVIDPVVLNLDVGAGQYRQFGRLALFNHVQRISDLLQGNMRAIQQKGATDIHVHIAASLAGGTGAALFLDVAHLVKQLAPTVGFKQTPVIIGHFVLPEGFRGTPQVELGSPGVAQDFEARAFAALRELSRLQGQVIPAIQGYPMVYDPNGSGSMKAKLMEKPYSAVYLYDGQRFNNPLNIYRIEDGLAPSIADAIVAYIDDKSGAAFRSHHVNVQRYASAKQVLLGQVTFGSIGTYTIELPIYHIIENWTHRLARDVLDLLLTPDVRDPASELPRQIAKNKPGGVETDAKSKAEDWLRTSLTLLVAQLAEWGMKGEGSPSLFKQAVGEALDKDAAGWQQALVSLDPSLKTIVDQAHDVLYGSLRDQNSPTYFVNHDQPGRTDEERAHNLQLEVDAKLRQMVGEPTEVWRRTGGDFRKVMILLAAPHANSFDQGLENWLRVTLNGDPNLAQHTKRKQGQLGYTEAFLERLDAVLKSSALVLRQAEEQGKSRRRTEYESIESRRKMALDEMRRKGGFRGSNRQDYRNLSDELAQFHKADIARQVAFELVERLQISVDNALKEMKAWERTLATASQTEGGVYALILRGQEEVEADRDIAKNAVRWVIDEEKQDPSGYISGKREHYSRDALNAILSMVEWKIGRSQVNGPIQVEFTLKGSPWDRLPPGNSPMARGQRNVSALLERCRAFFDRARDEISVTDYLWHTHKDDIATLANRVSSSSGYLLALANPVAQPRLKTTYMRVYEENLAQDVRAFLRTVRGAVARNFHDTSDAELRLQAEEGATVSIGSAEDSRDPFKLTFIMFGELLPAEDIQEYLTAQQDYRNVTGSGQWRPLHILSAETNALAIERTLGAGTGKTQQKRRELNERVVSLLEDMGAFQLGMRSLAYSQDTYDWGIEGERGLLLHCRFEEDGRSYWQLTLMPEGELRSGIVHDPITGNRARPTHYRLTNAEDEPDLLQAFIQLVILRRDVNSGDKIEDEPIQRTIRYAMDAHRKVWSQQLPSEWQAGERIANDDLLVAEAHDRAAQVIRLNAFIAAVAEPRLAEMRWAWSSSDSAVGEVVTEHTLLLQAQADLWTALRGAAGQELENLSKRLNQMGAWRRSTPNVLSDLGPRARTAPPPQRPTLPGPGSSVDAKDGAGSSTAPPGVVLSHVVTLRRGVLFPDGRWECPQGHLNDAEDQFCSFCDELVEKPKPEPGVVAPTLPGSETSAVEQTTPPPAPTRVCAGDGRHPLPDGANFCSICGAKPHDPPKGRACAGPDHHPMADDANYCSICGYQALSEASGADQRK